MPALIDLRRRIKSVRNTQQITQAMKTVATVKFKKAQRIVLEGRPSWHNYPELLSYISERAQWTEHALLDRREENKVLCLIVTTDKGLCGAFNSHLLEKVHAWLEDKVCNAEVSLLIAGKKARQFFAKASYPIEWVCDKEIHLLTAEDYSALARKFITSYAWSRTDAVYVAYNEFKSILSPTITIKRLLPVEIETGEDTSGSSGQSFEGYPPDFEPGAHVLLDRLLPLYIEDQVRHIFAESEAAEHAARMMAMDNASQAAEDLIGDLTLDLNKIRQSMITKELLEIISAVEALANK